jgi:hypothetical protein
VLGGLTLGSVALGAGGPAGVLVAGPLLGVLGGGVAGGFIGAMLTRGLEPEIADFYDQAVRKGRILVGVDADGAVAAETAERALAEAGAEPVELRRG